MIKSNKGLIGKAVMAKDGTPVGTISNSIIDRNTGQIKSIQVKPQQTLNKLENNVLTGNEYTFPSSCFITVKDVIIVEQELPTSCKKMNIK